MDDLEVEHWFNYCKVRKKCNTCKYRNTICPEFIKTCFIEVYENYKKYKMFEQYEQQQWEESRR